MFAMQYGFDLPSNFDMNVILSRAAEIGPRFNDLPGLHHKVFLIGDQQRGLANRYAPFYLWRNIEGMTAFLQSDAFAAVCTHYGRPPVQRWNGVGFIEGPGVHEVPLFAIQNVSPLLPEASLSKVDHDQRSALSALADDPSLHCAYVGLDPENWQLMQISLWLNRPVHSDGRVFKVGYLSHQDRS